MIGILILSHSNLIAKGLFDTCKQMAQETYIEYVGGIEDRLGLDVVLALETLNKMLAVSDAVIIYSDIGSTVLASKSIKEMSIKPDKVYIADAPLVEGAIAASVETTLTNNVEEILEESKKACFMEKSK
ncbi:MAG: PTS mannose transporter subunit IID [Desulfurella sp.]|uniref:PTS sugar transporter subunit IIA domain-containing protein n=1 Tax=Desulfurella sp. TaxID=1962857 RepID=UPI003C8232DA